jgi:hypothetical protein
MHDKKVKKKVAICISLFSLVPPHNFWASGFLLDYDHTLPSSYVIADRNNISKVLCFTSFDSHTDFKYYKN